MDEVDAFRMKRPADDTVSLVSSTPESLIVEGEWSKHVANWIFVMHLAALIVSFCHSDAYYTTLRGELESIAQDFEVESWSLAVDNNFLKKHTKEMAKRQDVIYG